MKTKIFLLVALSFLISNSYAQDKLYLIFELMKVDNEQEQSYWETETLWEKIHEQRAKNGEIIGWDLWHLLPGGESQGYQYMTATLFKDPESMFKGGNFFQHAKAAYPDKSEEELYKMLNKTAKSRDLSVRIFMELITRTDGFTDVELGTIATIDYMKVEMGKYDAYEKAEIEVFKPLHQKQVDNGEKMSWHLARIMLPFGSESYASHITVNMYNSIEQFFIESKDDTPLTEAQKKAIKEGLSTRDLKSVNLAKLVKQARP